MSSSDFSADSRVRVVRAHDPNAGPITAVRNIVLQSCLAQLRAKGYYERYCRYIATDVREELLSHIAPSWIPIEVAVAHYQACDMLDLTVDELAGMGASVGAQVSDVTLVSRARRVRDDSLDLSTVLSQLHRMWPRIYHGGSVHVSLEGPGELLIEQRGFVLNRFKYFRNSQANTIKTAHEAVGMLLESSRVERYNAARDETAYRLIFR